VKCFALVAVYMFFVNNSRLEERAQELQSHRSLERELLTKLNGDGTCDIGSPTHDANPAAADTTKTLLASYPGSGKVCVSMLLCSGNPISFTSVALLTSHCFL